MERHRDAAQTAFARMQDRINNLKQRIPHDTPVTLAATIDAASTAKYMFNSTLDRELWYCCMHAVRALFFSRKLGIYHPSMYTYVVTYITSLLDSSLRCNQGDLCGEWVINT